jgi:hypothetical protein
MIQYIKNPNIEQCVGCNKGLEADEKVYVEPGWGDFALCRKCYSEHCSLRANDRRKLREER